MPSNAYGQEEPIWVYPKQENELKEQHHQRI